MTMTDRKRKDVRKERPLIRLSFILSLASILLIKTTPSVVVSAQESMDGNTQPASPHSYYVPLTLSNGVEIPQLALGPGFNDGPRNYMMSHKLRPKLYDLSMPHRNVDAGRQRTIARLIRNKKKTQVITKVWHTRLGYARTTLTVKKSLEELEPVQNVHVMLQWPRCYSGVQHMVCGDKIGVSDKLQAAGPDPYLDVLNAWKESWKALEDLYDAEDRIVSIGVANFDMEQIVELLALCRIKPHIYQASLNVFMNHQDVFALLRENSVAVQLYNVFDDTVSKLGIGRFPGLYFHFKRIGTELQKTHNLDVEITPAQIILAWIFQNKYPLAVVMRTEQKEHFEESFAFSHVPTLDAIQSQAVVELIFHLWRNEDVDAPVANVRIFLNNNFRYADEGPSDVDMYVVNSDTGVYTSVSPGPLRAQEKNEIMAFKGHKFAMVDDTDKVHHFEVTAERGEIQRFHIGGKEHNELYITDDNCAHPYPHNGEGRNPMTRAPPVKACEGIGQKIRTHDEL